MNRGNNQIYFNIISAITKTLKIPTIPQPYPPATSSKRKRLMHSCLGGNKVYALKLMKLSQAFET